MPREHLRVFVATGNGPPFDRLLNALRDVAAHERGYELFVQRGQAGERYRELPGADFISRAEFDERLRWADFAVIHGGAGSLYEAITAGHTPIVVPRLSAFSEIVNDHQLELAEALAALGHVQLCTQPSALPSVLERASPRAHRAPPALNEFQEAVREELLTTTRATTLELLGGVSAMAASLARRARRRVS